MSYLVRHHQYQTPVDMCYLVLDYSNYSNRIMILLPGNVVNAVHHARVINREIRMAQVFSQTKLWIT